MGDITFLKQAVDCIKSLQRARTRNGNLFEDPNNTSVASALSMLSHTAHFIEQYVNNNNQMHDISIIIACRVKRESRNHSSQSTKDPTFVLWNTVTGARQNSRNGTAPRAPENDAHFENSDGNPLTEQSPQSNPSQHLPQSNLSQPLSQSNPSQRLPQSNPSENVPQLNPSEHQQSQTPQPEEETYGVPVQIASRCLQLLLDGSGFSSHKNIFQRKSYCELGSKPLEEAIRKVFDAERSIRTNPSGSSSSSSTGSKASKTDDMIYSDLLPDNLRRKEGEGTMIVSVPEITFSPRGESVVSSRMKVGMNIRKPDRNTKTQNFALLCALLDHTGPHGTCAKVLKGYAQEGFSQEGCKRRKRFSTSAKSNCSGAQSCDRCMEQLCTFYISSCTIAVGMGTVDPFITSFDGRSIPGTHVLVRFGSVTNIRELSFPSNLSDEQQEEVHSKWMTGPAVWQKSHIERIELLGDYKPIGTAILVQDLIPASAHHSILKRVRRNSPNSITDVANATVVCDVILTETNLQKQTERYPYMEWYNLPSLKMLRTLHFGGTEPPKTLSSPFLGKAKALLWNKNKYKRIARRES